MGVKRAARGTGRYVKRNHLAIIGIGLMLAGIGLVFPTETRQAAEQASSSSEDLLGGLLGLAGENLTTTGFHEVQVKYESGTLVNLGIVTVDTAGDQEAEFRVTGTSASGNTARFELLCGDGDTCRGALAPKDHFYQDPATFWTVTVPSGVGVTSLKVTAGGALLEVPLEGS